MPDAACPGAWRGTLGCAQLVWVKQRPLVAAKQAKHMETQVGRLWQGEPVVLLGVLRPDPLLASHRRSGAT